MFFRQFLSEYYTLINSKVLLAFTCDSFYVLLFHCNYCIRHQYLDNVYFLTVCFVFCEFYFLQLPSILFQTIGLCSNQPAQMKTQSVFWCFHCQSRRLQQKISLTLGVFFFLQKGVTSFQYVSVSSSKTHIFLPKYLKYLCHFSFHMIFFLNKEQIQFKHTNIFHTLPIITNTRIVLITCSPR